VRIAIVYDNKVKWHGAPVENTDVIIIIIIITITIIMIITISQRILTKGRIAGCRFFTVGKI